MTDEEPKREAKKTITKNVTVNRGGGNAVYGLGMLGALVFYIQQVSGFWPVIAAIFKGIFWPAFVVYDLLRHIS